MYVHTYIRKLNWVDEMRCKFKFQMTLRLCPLLFPLEINNIIATSLAVAGKNALLKEFSSVYVYKLVQRI